MIDTRLIDTTDDGVSNAPGTWLTHVSRRQPRCRNSARVNTADYKTTIRLITIHNLPFSVQTTRIYFPGE